MDTLYELLDFFYDALYQIWLMVSEDWGWIGVSVIGLAVFRRVVKLIRKVY